MKPVYRRWLRMAVWPFPNLRTWTAFAGSVFVGGLTVALLVGISFVLVECRP